MKKNLICLAAFIAASIMMVSCTKEPDEQQTPTAEPTMSELILGTWDMDCAASTFHEKWVSTIDPYVWDYPASEIMCSASYTFSQDGTALITVDYNENYDELDLTDTTCYEVKGDTLFLGGDEMYQITKLDDKQLVIDISDSEENPEGTYLWTIHIVLNRRN